MKKNYYILLIILFTSCSFNSRNRNSSENNSERITGKEDFPDYSYSEQNSIPNSPALFLPEDGAGLPDGRIVVSDNEDGLHVILKDGSNRPFGNMKKAGYSRGGARGVFLENDANHILVSCINSGELYRINVEKETSKIIYKHQYGINNIYKDKTGNIWFTQSGTNEDGTTKALDEAFANPIPTGGLFRLEWNEVEKAYLPIMMADSLYFANGVTMDEREEHIFVAEFRMDRILRFKVDNDTLSNKEQYSIILSPDNLERDIDGNIWVASLIQNKIFAIDKKNKSRNEVFSTCSNLNRKKQEEWVKKTHLGKSLKDIGHPDMWNPLTGPLTGIFWSYDQKEVYFTGLGTNILKYPFHGDLN